MKKIEIKERYSVAFSFLIGYLTIILLMNLIFLESGKWYFFGVVIKELNLLFKIIVGTILTIVGFLIGLSLEK